MLLLVQQLLAIVLAVDIQQAAAQGAELGNGDGASVDPADILAVAVDLPLQKQLPLPGDAQVLPQPGRNVREARADKGHIGPVRIRSREVPLASTALMESMTMDLPAPVSPVRALKPAGTRCPRTR